MFTIHLAASAHKYEYTKYPQRQRFRTQLTDKRRECTEHRMLMLFSKKACSGDGGGTGVPKGELSARGLRSEQMVESRLLAWLKVFLFLNVVS